jgi:hypothetical protein
MRHNYNSNRSKPYDCYLQNMRNTNQKQRNGNKEIVWKEKCKWTNDRTRIVLILGLKDFQGKQNRNHTSW